MCCGRTRDRRPILWSWPDRSGGRTGVVTAGIAAMIKGGEGLGRDLCAMALSGGSSGSGEPLAGPLEGETNYEVYGQGGRPITDIDLVKGNTLWEEKSIEGVSGNQTIDNWVNENVYTKFYRCLAARGQLPGYYSDASIGFNLTGQNLDPQLQSAIEGQVEYLREINSDVNIRLEFFK